MQITYKWKRVRFRGYRAETPVGPIAICRTGRTWTAIAVGTRIATGYTLASTKRAVESLPPGYLEVMACDSGTQPGSRGRANGDLRKSEERGDGPELPLVGTKSVSSGRYPPVGVKKTLACFGLCEA